jgi:hypothetical protein
LEESCSGSRSCVLFCNPNKEKKRWLISKCFLKGSCGSAQQGGITAKMSMAAEVMNEVCWVENMHACEETYRTSL